MDEKNKVVTLSFIDANKIVHSAFVEYFLLLKKIEKHQCGWTDDIKDEAIDILDRLANKYAKLSNSEE